MTAALKTQPTFPTNKLPPLPAHQQANRKLILPLVRALARAAAEADQKAEACISNSQHSPSHATLNHPSVTRQAK